MSSIGIATGSGNGVPAGLKIFGGCRRFMDFESGHLQPALRIIGKGVRSVHMREEAFRLPPSKIFFFWRLLIPFRLSAKALQDGSSWFNGSYPDFL